ncbi:Uncharacterized protein GBIM_05682 [Gryllus bimaculatus]|nr:Uncharacterized protein GBIM_05682 [Gryllus bimaculatus]
MNLFAAVPTPIAECWHTRLQLECRDRSAHRWAPLGLVAFGESTWREASVSIKHRSKPMTSKARLWATIKTWCLPKMICELHATPSKERLTDGERSLLALIRDTSLSATAEVTSRYHFAAHMGQLIAGVDGTGCHNFYPQCPFPGPHVMSMMKRVKIR